MRTSIVPLVIFASVVLVLPTHAQTPVQRGIGESLMHSLLTRDFPTLRSLLSPQLQGQMDIPRWKELADRIEATAGPVRRHELHSATLAGSAANLVYRCWFSKDSVDFRVVVDSMNLVGGFWIEPIRKKYAFVQPPYALTTRFSEQTVWIGDTVRLPGVLTLPKDQGPGPFAAVVLVHGSGPQDRDETIYGNKPFRDLAWGLATRGIVVLRYDKRTKALPRRINPATLTVQDEVVDDATAAVRFLAQRSEVDTTRLSVIGHSLGAMLAPLIARQESRVRGIAMLAAPARSLERLIVTQLRFQASLRDSLTHEERTALESELARLDSVDRGTLPDSALLIGSIPARYLYDLRARKVVDVTRGLTIPIFLAGGGKDYQVPPEEFATWKELLSDAPNVSFHEYPDCTHLFMTTKEKPSPSNYEEEGHVVETLIDDLTKWIKRK